MTNNEVKLLKKYCVNHLGRKWSDVLNEFNQKRLADALKWAENRKGKPPIDSLLADVENLPDDIPEPVPMESNNA